MHLLSIPVSLELKGRTLTATLTEAPAMSTVIARMCRWAGDLKTHLEPAKGREKSIKLYVHPLLLILIFFLKKHGDGFNHESSAAQLKWGLFLTGWTFSFVIHQRHAALEVLLVNVMYHLAGTPWAALLSYNKMAADSEGTILWPHPSLEAWRWNCNPHMPKKGDFMDV